MENDWMQSYKYFARSKQFISVPILVSSFHNRVHAEKYALKWRKKRRSQRYHELGRKTINLPVVYKLLNSTFFKYIFNCFFSLSRCLWATEGSQNFNVYKLCRLQRATSWEDEKRRKMKLHSSNISFENVASAFIALYLTWLSWKLYASNVIYGHLILFSNKKGLDI